MPVGSALRLTPADYCIEQRTLYIRPSKFHKDRLIPIGPKVAANLDHLLSLSPGSGNTTGRVLFLKLPQFQPYRRDWISAYFRQVLQHLGIYRRETYQQGCYYGTPPLARLAPGLRRAPLAPLVPPGRRA
jgi:hypothetical protein